MENIINKANKGGFKVMWDKTLEKPYWSDGCGGYFVDIYRIFMTPLFWQALSKACGWEGKDSILLDNNENYKKVDKNIIVALQFHEINLIQSFDRAVEWLEELVTL